jgi:uncharacterized protein (TIGR02757 family)
MYTDQELKWMLEEAYGQFARPDFIDNDPIKIPKRFSSKEDIEIAGFLTATIAWGQRISIIKSANRLMALMDEAPHDFIVNHEAKDRKRFKGFVHRTFNADDAMFFMASLQHIYTKKQGLESAFSSPEATSNFERLSRFHELFFSIEHLDRSKKHVSNPVKGSSAKRLNMFLRWMVRSSKEGIDFGIWKSISASELMIPLDVHTGNVARKLGLLTRKQDDWKAVNELTQRLTNFDANDPVRYDLALFGMGVNGAPLPSL